MKGMPSTGTLLSRLSSFSRRAVAALSAAVSLLIVAAPSTAVAAAKVPAAHPVKVMIITLFGPEAAPWLAQLPIRQTVRVAGL
jgi:purine nucleoside permease